MPTITKKQLEDYNKLCEDRTYGRILTPDGLRMICEANNSDPEAIGKQMLETYAKFKNKGVSRWKQSWIYTICSLRTPL